METVFAPTTRTSNRIATKITNISAEAVKVSPKQDTFSIVRPQAIPITSRIPPFVRPPVPEAIIRPTFGFKLPQQTQTQKGFNVFVRRGGEFRKVSPFALTEQSALAFGQRRVGTTAAASFKIEEASVGGTDLKIRPDLSDFYKSTKEKGVFVEKKERRIKSAGELSEITFKGIKASQEAKKFRIKRKK